jgi:hypothetical protein
MGLEGNEQLLLSGYKVSVTSDPRDLFYNSVPVINNSIAHLKFVKGVDLALNMLSTIFLLSGVFSLKKD